MPDEEEDLDPARITEVYIVQTHCKVTASGIWSITAYDALGNELADAPMVPGEARDWAEALEMFWRDVGEKARNHNAAPFN